MVMGFGWVKIQKLASMDPDHYWRIIELLGLLKHLWNGGHRKMAHI